MSGGYGQRRWRCSKCRRRLITATPKQPGPCGSTDKSFAHPCDGRMEPDRGPSPAAPLRALEAVAARRARNLGTCPACGRFLNSRGACPSCSR